jgi:hypothetical protein
MVYYILYGGYEMVYFCVGYVLGILMGFTISIAVSIFHHKKITSELKNMNS